MAAASAAPSNQTTSGGTTIAIAKSPNKPTITTYLKSYPYLFVRESDQTDYFCTLCDAYLNEEELQSHLFDGHLAENLKDFFVRVSTENHQQQKQQQFYSLKKRHLYICVVCWAKIVNPSDMILHRNSCKTDAIVNTSTSESASCTSPVVKVVQDDEPPTNVVSTPDIQMLIGEDAPEAIIGGDGGSSINRATTETPPSSPRSSHGSLIIDVQDAVSHTDSTRSSNPATVITSTTTQLKRGRKKQLYPQQVLPKSVVPSILPMSQLPTLSLTPTHSLMSVTSPNSVIYQQHTPSILTTTVNSQVATKFPSPPQLPPPIPSLVEQQLRDTLALQPLRPMSDASTTIQPMCASTCIQCSLCGAILPSSTYMKHLREFHRVACSLDTTMCPLCMGTVPLMDMTVHLSAMHGVAPQPAVNALLLWALANNTFVMNEKTKESLKTKTLGLAGMSTGVSAIGNLNIATTTTTMTISNAITTPSPSFSSGFLPSLIGAVPTAGQTMQNHLLTQSAASTVLDKNGLPSLSLDTTGKMASGISNVMPNMLTGNCFPNVSFQPGGMLNGAVSSSLSSSQADMTSLRIPSFLQALLHTEPAHNARTLAANNQALLPKITIENVVAKLTRSHIGTNAKESFQCLVCTKWFAVPPIKHMRGHIIASREARARSMSLMGGSSHVCLVCYQIFETISGMSSHLATLHPLPGDGNEGCGSSNRNIDHDDDLPLGATYENAVGINSFPNVTSNNISTIIVDQHQPVEIPIPSQHKPKNRSTTGSVPKTVSNGKGHVELDNAGRVKSGKVRKQCELCGQWSNIKWFFKHMSEVHQALFCRCCREYLPIPEQEEHRRWHAEPPYMGQKIRIENGQPVIIDRKERASLTPIGSLASWGGSSGGMVVKAIDDGVIASTPSSRKRKAVKNSDCASTAASSTTNNCNNSNNNQSDVRATTAKDCSSHVICTPPKMLNLTTGVVDFSCTATGGGPTGVVSPQLSNSPKGTGTPPSSSSPLSSSFAAVTNATVKDTLMPKETCPVCGILITYKNLARHIKLRHKIKYKFCHKCRKLVPNDTYENHKLTCTDTGLTGVDFPVEDFETNMSPPPVPLIISPPPLQMQQKGIQMTRSDHLDMKNSNGIAVAVSVAESMNTSPSNTIRNGSISSADEVLSVDVRKTDFHRASTSKTKLESLLGKEFKHPRRRCSICGYTVSYSNFKRHLRNAHPCEYSKLETDWDGDFRKAVVALSHPIESGEDAANADVHLLSLPMEADDDGYIDEEEDGDIGEDEEPLVGDDDEDDDDENDKDCPDDDDGIATHNAEDDKGSTFAACSICGDHILEDFMDRHIKLNHSEFMDRNMELDEGDVEDKDVEIRGSHEDKVDDKGERVEVDETKMIEEATEEEEEEKVQQHTFSSATNPSTQRLTVPRKCPVCSQEMRAEIITRHCKLNHKLSLKWCGICGKYLMKRHYRNHARKHEKCEQINPLDPEEQISTDSANTVGHSRTLRNTSGVVSTETNNEYKSRVDGNGDNEVENDEDDLGDAINAASSAPDDIEGVSVE